EMLRSKSMDRDSYDSGDWFNRLDFSYARTGWGSGLPIADKNADRWAMMKPLLANEELVPGRGDIEATVRVFEDLLRIRRSSPLFRMREAREVQARVRFENTGPESVPGLIVMSLNDRVPGPPDADPVREELVLVFNATPDAKEWMSMGRAGMAGRLHAVQANGADPVVRGAAYDAAAGTFRVPAWTTAVFEFLE
ncbi:DUF3372 domain-containing protein, partial [bacterium]|nr:DUF3372 domain-containing protein [bacterium]